MLFELIKAINPESELSEQERKEELIKAGPSSLYAFAQAFLGSREGLKKK